MKKCDDCKYYEKVTADWGECRVKAPVILEHTGSNGGHFPEVSKDFWCGEYKVGGLVKNQYSDK